ncbi:hypothetical protein SCOCK_210119 [Actinacidiphila cocklensis]|uniref:Uncharacterized protein n=1 Tax=Actinacidiphila cocklensis TaxID=887465 RepID=A0A9W4GQK1_9ACTN|nr:hypothetical protein SCOCK_210119 [Actinacidiphila cocklensis]
MRQPVDMTNAPAISPRPQVSVHGIHFTAQARRIRSIRCRPRRRRRVGHGGLARPGGRRLLAVQEHRDRDVPDGRHERRGLGVQLHRQQQPAVGLGRRQRRCGLPAAQEPGHRAVPGHRRQEQRQCGLDEFLHVDRRPALGLQRHHAAVRLGARRGAQGVLRRLAAHRPRQLPGLGGLAQLTTGRRGSSRD